jgi:hypothetical protein
MRLRRAGHRAQIAVGGGSVMIEVGLEKRLKLGEEIRLQIRFGRVFAND